MRLHGRQVRIKTARGERLHFFDRAGRDHLVEARIDPAHERVAVRREKDLGRACGIKARGVALFVPIQSERPVASTTSSARVMRARSPGISRAAAAGSRCISSVCSLLVRLAFEPRAHLFADLVAGIGGTAASPRMSALK